MMYAFLLGVHRLQTLLIPLEIVSSMGPLLTYKMKGCIRFFQLFACCAMGNVIAAFGEEGLKLFPFAIAVS